MTGVGRHACSRNACSQHVRRRPPDTDRKSFEVLHDCGEVELVARAREPPQSHALEAMMGLEVRKPHLHFLPFIPRLLVLRGDIERTGVVARLFVDVARDLPERRARASRLELTGSAISGL